MWTVSRRTTASADAVWRTLIDLDAWPEWGPTVQGADLDSDGFGLGATGRVYTPVGVALPFVISDFEPGRRWGWTVMGVPATKHGVEAVDGGSRVWMSAPLWAPAYLPVLQVALRRIDKMAS
jgi:hypothetical protein